MQNTLISVGRKALAALAASVLVLSTFGVSSALVASAAAPAPVAPIDLLSAGNYAILAETEVTTTGPTTITGNVGVSPHAATGLTGFSQTMDSSNQFSTSPYVVGNLYASDYAPPTPANLTTAVKDMQTAYTTTAGITNPTATELGAGNIGGMTIYPGVYKWSNDVNIPTSVTLSGGPNDVWIFQIAGNLNIASAGSVASGIKVLLAGGAQASNVFWQVGGPTGATLGTYSTFNGTILSAKQVILQTGAVLNGRALAQSQVTLDANAVSNPLPTGNLGGTVTSGPGVLTVTSITPVQTSAISDNTYADGWSYLFNITVPTNEPNLAMQFSDWTGAGTIPVANNMQISSAQALASTTPVIITAANTYSAPALDMTGDLSTTTPGLQVQVLVQTKIPLNTVNGAYTTNYGVQTLH